MPSEQTQAAMIEARAALYGCKGVLGDIANIGHAIDLLNAAIHDAASKPAADVVERVARAIAAAEWTRDARLRRFEHETGDTAERYAERSWGLWTDHAIAALEASAQTQPAMSGVTKEMIAAAYTVPLDVMLSGSELTAIYTAMREASEHDQGVRELVERLRWYTRNWPEKAQLAGTCDEAADLIARLTTPIEADVESLGEALFNLSDSLREIGFFSGQQKHIDRYEAVVREFQGLAAMPRTEPSEVERLRVLLRRWVETARSGHWRDRAELSIQAHPVFDATVDALRSEQS